MTQKIISLMVISFLFSTSPSTIGKTPLIKKEKLAIKAPKIVLDTLALTKENVYMLCEEYCHDPVWVWKQSMLESGHLKSQKCTKYNNLFGMKMPKNRETLAIGETEDGHAIFNSWHDSVKDFALWQKYRPIKDSTDYVTFLVVRGYCPINSNYTNTLKNIKFRF